MEFAGRLNLCKYLARPDHDLKIADALHLYSQIVAGVLHCHQRDTAHRDIKPENIALMVCEDSPINVRIIDFGCAVRSTDVCRDFVGTIPFVAPELALRSPREHYDPFRADMWSCGVVLLEILCGINKIKRMLQERKCPAEVGVA